MKSGMLSANHLLKHCFCLLGNLINSRFYADVNPIQLTSIWEFALLLFHSSTHTCLSLMRMCKFATSDKRIAHLHSCAFVGILSRLASELRWWVVFVVRERKSTYTARNGVFLTRVHVRILVFAWIHWREAKKFLASEQGTTNRYFSTNRDVTERHR